VGLILGYYKGVSLIAAMKELGQNGATQDFEFIVNYN